MDYSKLHKNSFEGFLNFRGTNTELRCLILHRDCWHPEHYYICWVVFIKVLSSPCWPGGGGRVSLRPLFNMYNMRWMKLSVINERTCWNVSQRKTILILNNKYVNPYLGQNSPKKQIFQRYNIYFSESNSQNIKATNKKQPTAQSISCNISYCILHSIIHYIF